MNYLHETALNKDKEFHISCNIDVPLCVDMDGTLIKTDIFFETLIIALRKRWRNVFFMPIWLSRGKAFLKRKLLGFGVPDPQSIPYNSELIEYLKSERDFGRKITLVTASDILAAGPVARHVGVFDDVMASDGGMNLKGAAKAQALVNRFGERGFVYAGNDKSDLEVWRRARCAIVVNAPEGLARKVAETTPIVCEFPGRIPVFRELVRAMRCYQWVKNILVFVPIVAAHRFFEMKGLIPTLLVFLALCAGASGGYLINDLMDIESDRRHPRKRERPFASGNLPLQFCLLGPILSIIGLIIGMMVSVICFMLILLYITLSISYSEYLKTRPIIDIFLLAGLYTLRVVIGGVSSGNFASIWLLNFSGFLFLSLGILKRYSEYSEDQGKEGNSIYNRRGYTKYDMQALIIMGISSSFTSAVILGLYIDSTQAQVAYRTPLILWGIVPLVLFWQCRMWLATTRGYMLDDPIVYAAKDRVSKIIGFLSLTLFILASIDIKKIFTIFYNHIFAG
jgi:4-hydroxybenzoate polyprenyltransferase